MFLMIMGYFRSCLMYASDASLVNANVNGSTFRGYQSRGGAKRSHGRPAAPSVGTRRPSQPLPTISSIACFQISSLSCVILLCNRSCLYHENFIKIP